MAKTIIIGDVHGCFDELMDLLEKIGPSEDDQIYFVGDLITKGPDSRKVLDFLIDNTQMKTVIGNHEYALLMSYKNQPVILKKSQKKTKKELGKRFAHYMDIVARWPAIIHLKRNGLIVHAGIRPNLPLRNQTLEDLTNIRTVNGEPWFDRYYGNERIVFGHWVSAQPIVRKKAIGIDTGCVYGGRLTALLWPEIKFVSVPARDNYADRGKKS